MPPDIIHVDLDAFYASVERRRDPSLRGRPVVVGGDGSRGVVLSCSYEARAAGVRNGMPSMRARRLCPGTVFVAPDFDAYREASRGFRAILEAFTPTVEPLSLDEAFCDVTGAHRLFGTTDAIGREIRRRVDEELHLTCSVGAGPTKLVAKIASRTCKPDGLCVIGDVQAFLHPMAVSQLWGVGDATVQVLHRLHVTTIGDLAATPRWILHREFGRAAGEHLADLASGIDPSPVTPHSEAKSVGAEQTFDIDVASDDRLATAMLKLTDKVASRLNAQGLSGRTVTLKIRLESFATHTRSHTLDHATSDVWTIFRVAREALTGFGRQGQRVRLLGVTVSNLQRGDAAHQLSLYPGPSYAAAEQAMMRVRDRFGYDAVTLARLVDGLEE